MDIGAAIGSFIVGAGDALTGGWFTGRERDEQRTVRAEEIARQNYWNEQGKNQLQTNIDIAKRNHIDPLAVLGSNVGSVSTTPVQQPTTHGNFDSNAMATLASSMIMADVEREKAKQLEALSKISETQTGVAPQNTPNKIALPPKLGVDQTGSTYLTFATLPDGGLVPVPSKEIKELIEDSPQELEHYIRIMGHNYLGSRTFAPRPDYDFDSVRNAWYPRGQPRPMTVDQVKDHYKNSWARKGTKLSFPIGKKISRESLNTGRPGGLNPNNAWPYSSHGKWKLDKSGKNWILYDR